MTKLYTYSALPQREEIPLDIYTANDCVHVCDGASAMKMAVAELDLGSFK